MTRRFYSSVKINIPVVCLYKVDNCECIRRISRITGSNTTTQQVETQHIDIVWQVESVVTLLKREVLNEAH